MGNSLNVNTTFTAKNYSNVTNRTVGYTTTKPIPLNRPPQDVEDVWDQLRALACSGLRLFTDICHQSLHGNLHFCQTQGCTLYVHSEFHDHRHSQRLGDGRALGNGYLVRLLRPVTCHIPMPYSRILS